jgi:hypothetical protein
VFGQVQKSQVIFLHRSMSPAAKPSRDQRKRMPSPMKEPSHAEDECLGAAKDIGDNGRMQQSRRLTAIIERG